MAHCRNREVSLPLSNYALDNFVAQYMSGFTAPVLRSVADKYPNHNTWLTTFVLNSILTTPLSQLGTSLAFAILRRATAALEEYDEACQALAHPASSRILTYFKAQRKIEYSIASLYQAFDVARKALRILLFEPNDGSPKERLCTIYNRSRHADPQKRPPGHLHAIWLQNDGIHSWGDEESSSDVSLSFTEFEELLEEVASLADKIAKCEKPQSDTGGPHVAPQ